MLLSRGLAAVMSAALTLALSGQGLAQETDEDEDGIQFVQDKEAAPAPASAPEPVPTSPAEATAEPAKAPEATPPEPTAPAAAAGDTAEPEVEHTVPKLRVRGKRNPDELFGTYRIRVGMARPNFDDGLKFYDKLYGDPEWYPTLAADWFAWDWYATLGLSFRAGYYTAGGNAARVVAGKSTKDLEASDIEKDPNGPTTLTLLPLQVAFTAEITPFSGKWLVLDGWFGVERLYWQEVRASSQTDETASIRFATAEEDDSNDALTNKGWKNATVIGASANILLNPIDEGAASSMRGSMGLGFIYLSPFMEIVRTTSKDGVSFGRTSYGLGFTFESSH